MVLDDIQKGAKNPILPFVGRVTLSAATVTGLVGGFALLGVLKPAGENLGDMASNKFADLTGLNPQTGQTNQNQAAIGGA